MTRGISAFVRLAGAVALLTACASGTSTTSAAGPGSAGPGPGDWPAYNRTLAGDRFSPLTEISRANVAGIHEVCTYALPEVTSFQTGPVIVGGTMYFTTDTISYAIDAATCAEKWRQVRHSATPNMLSVHRGFAFMNGRLFRGTSDAHVLALDAADGHTLWDVTLDVAAPGVTLPMAPIAHNGRVYIGNAGGDLVGITGHVYALDARDGHVIWKFDVVPNTYDVRTTWPNANGLPAGGAFWTSFTFDTQNNLLFVPSGNPAPDFDIELRQGDNLYTNSVIALDAATGRMVKYNQIVKRDFHDWDVDSPPTLVTTRAGQNIVASANKDGQLSVLDRDHSLELLYQVPTTTRENATTPLSRDHKTRFCPGIQGGSEWNGAAYSPQFNTLYVGAVDWCAHVQLAPKGAATPAPGQVWFGTQTPMNEMFDPPTQARGWITAFDAENGNVRWKFQAPKPVLAGVTPTAGGIVLAADMGGVVYAFDAENGNILWQMDTGQSIGGGIVTYIAGGRQLVAIASGMKSPVWPGAASRSRVLVYGLK